MWWQLLESSSPTETTVPNIACWSKCKRQRWKKKKNVLFAFRMQLCFCKRPRMPYLKVFAPLALWFPPLLIQHSYFRKLQVFLEAMLWAGRLLHEPAPDRLVRNFLSQVMANCFEGRPLGDSIYVTFSAGQLLIGCITNIYLAVYSWRQQDATRRSSSQTQQCRHSPTLPQWCIFWQLFCCLVPPTLLRMACRSLTQPLWPTGTL